MLLKIFLKKKDKNVRNLNNITYRVLNFIFYSCVFFSETKQR